MGNLGSIGEYYCLDNGESSWAMLLPYGIKNIDSALICQEGKLIKSGCISSMWSCTNWGECGIEGKQKRTCKDNCFLYQNPPEITKECISYLLHFSITGTGTYTRDQEIEDWTITLNR